MPKPSKPSLHAVAALLLLGAAPCLGAAAEVGETLPNPELRDASDKPAKLPDLGAKVLAVFYTDADEKDMNDPLADAIKARKFDEQRYRGLGVVNLADSKAPNFLIRKAVRDKIAKYKSTILTDPDHALAKAWKLGDCNNTSVVLVIAADGKVAHVQRGPIRGDDLGKIVELIAGLVAAAPVK
ncbi:MAG: YtfJ family protein [Anaeromyxobacteraceae bacterium]